MTKATDRPTAYLIASHESHDPGLYGRFFARVRLPQTHATAPYLVLYRLADAHVVSIQAILQTADSSGRPDRDVRLGLRLEVWGRWTCQQMGNYVIAQPPIPRSSFVQRNIYQPWLNAGG